MEWDKLSLQDKAKYIRLGVQSGIYDLNTIKQAINTYQDGGYTNNDKNSRGKQYSSQHINDLFNQNFKQEWLGEPLHHYDVTISDQEADSLGYKKNYRNHRDDRVKKPAHPTYPNRGHWVNYDSDFSLSESGLDDSNHTLFGTHENDPNARILYNNSVVLPEVTVTPKGNYYYNPYDNIKYYGGGGLTSNDPILLPEIVVTPTLQQMALIRSRRATEPNTDFSTAQDMSGWSKFSANYLAGILSNPRTCINTVTAFNDPNNTVASNVNFVTKPNEYGYKEISQDEAVPGDIIILSDKNNHPHHAVMFDSVSEQEGTHNGYPIEIGDTLVNYSNGGRDASSYRLQGPLPRFDDPIKAGGDFSGTHRYFRYTGKKKKYGPGGFLNGPINPQRYQDDIEYRKSVLASLSQQQKSKQARVDAAYKKEQQQGKANEVTNYQTQTERAEQDRIDKDNADKYVHGLFDEKSWRDFALTQAAGVAAFPLVYYTAPYIWKGANLVGDVYLPYDLATRGYDLAHNFYDMYKYRNPTNAEERLKLATARVDAFENGFGVAGDALGLSSALHTTDKMMTRAAEMGIRNSGGHTTGMPYITNIKNDIKASQIKPTIDYILGVTPEAPKKQIFYDNNYNGFTGPLSDYVSTDVDMVSAFLHNKEIDSDVLTFKGRGKDFGVHTDYINKVYPKKAPKIPVYEQRGMDIGNYQQVKVVGKEGSIDTNISGVRVDAGGHLREIVRSEDGTYYMREQDIWKYNQPEYREKWLMPHNGNIFKNFLQDRALDYLNAKGTPVITRSSWRPITEVDFIMAGIDIPQDYSSYKQLQAESKYLDFEKSLQQVKKPTKAQNVIANIDKGAVENPSTEISKNN